MELYILLQMNGKEKRKEHEADEEKSEAWEGI